MALRNEVQSWARCTECGDVLWCEVSVHDQAVICTCGGVWLKNAEYFKTDGLDPTFKEAEMEAILLAERTERTVSTTRSR